MTVLLSLVAALSYGLGDFVGGVSAKRSTAWAVAVTAQFGGAAVMLLVSLAVPGTPSTADLWWAGTAGIANGFGTAFLYRGLSSGRMGVVAPVSGVGTAVVPVVIGLWLGERPSAIVWLGMLVAAPAIWLVSREAPEQAGATAQRSGFLDGVLAGLGFGTLFALLAQVGRDAGLVPLAVNEIIAGLAVVVVALVMHGDWVPRNRHAGLGVVSGTLGGVATFAFLLATHHGFLSVAAVLTSLYPAITVVLAATVLREHIHRGQAWGLAACGLAIALVAAG
ncbi:MAG: EamA family transporter [Nocardioidaceae bacterium]